MKTFQFIFAIGFSLATFASCNNAKDSKNETSTDRLENFTNNKDADKQQLFLRIVDELQTDSSHIYVAKSVFEQDTVGLQFEVLNAIKPGVNGQGQPTEQGFVKGAIKFSSLGEPSDALVQSLSSIFKIPGATAMKKDVILPTVFSSNTVETDLTKKATYSFKLFFENEVGEPAEVFAILDLYKRSLEISEKDASFRGQLLSAFSE